MVSFQNFDFSSNTTFLNFEKLQVAKNDDFVAMKPIITFQYSKMQWKTTALTRSIMLQWGIFIPNQRVYMDVCDVTQRNITSCHVMHCNAMTAM